MSSTTATIPTVPERPAGLIYYSINISIVRNRQEQPDSSITWKCLHPRKTQDLTTAMHHSSKTPTSSPPYQPDHPRQETQSSTSKPEVLANSPNLTSSTSSSPQNMPPPSSKKQPKSKESPWSQHPPPQSASSPSTASAPNGNP